jgi:putative transposase
LAVLGVLSPHEGCYAARMRYRRARVLGGSYFFTLVTEGRRPAFAAAAAVEALRAAFRLEMRRAPFTLDAIVVLPDHLHCVWTLPEGDADYPERWRRIKAGVTRRLPEARALPRSASRAAKGELGLWQRRFWEHAIRGEADWRAHVDYIHWNPVRHGLAASPAAWPWSSFRRFVTQGLYPAEWGEAPCDLAHGAGEVE